MVELLFQLQQDEDGWPPVAVEGLWCEAVGSLYRVQTCPLFVKGISVGDLIDVQCADEHEVEAFTVSKPSDNTTVWIIFLDPDVIEKSLQQLRSVGCNTTGPLEGWTTKLCSVDVPAGVEMSVVDAIVHPLEQMARVAVAFPSYRHPEG